MTGPRQGFGGMAFAAKAGPGLYGRLAARDLGPADAAVIRDEGFGTFARMSHEALRQPGGVVEEYLTWMRPWGFALEDLRVGVDVWAGADDSLIDPRWPQELARRIPHAVLHMRSGGHFMAHLHTCTTARFSNRCAERDGLTPRASPPICGEYGTEGVE